MNYERDIIEHLLKKYERSKSFNSSNKIVQTFKVDIKKLFPKYGDSTHFEQYQQLNDAILTLEKNEMIKSIKTKGGRYTQLCLNVEKLDFSYAYIGRSKKSEHNEMLETLFQNYNKGEGVLHHYCKDQIERIKQNKTLKLSNSSVEEHTLVLKAIDHLLLIEEEIYMRDFSVKVFKDSKIFETLSPKILSVLAEYGDFSDKSSVFSELNLIKNPSIISFKGRGKLFFEDQIIDLNKIEGDLSLSSNTLKTLKKIEVTGKRVLTIENRTSFYTTEDKDSFIIYLGGFHSSAKTKFLKLISQYNEGLEYYHFGDIDVGGFNILHHLCEETGLSFKPLLMDVETLKKYSESTKPLTENDKHRIKRHLANNESKVLEYMLENDCKLEQEAIDYRETINIFYNSEA